jgi:glutamate synthase (ferredoxin)
MEQPYGKWLEDNRIHLSDLPKSEDTIEDQFDTIENRQKAFGFTFEDIRFLVQPSAKSGKQPLGSMGNDAPLAVLSDKQQLLYNYFKQLFAQVTNPPIDPIREELVTASISFLGSEGDLTQPSPSSCRMLKLESPLLDEQAIAKIKAIQEKDFEARTLPITFEVESSDAINEQALKSALDQLFQSADQAIEAGVNLIILSDREVSQNKAPIPTLLATAGLHHHLIRQGTRTKVSLIVESAEPREVQHFALLLGFGADAINPYLSLESVRFAIANGDLELPADQACANFLKAN